MMKRAPNAPTPEAYLQALSGWQRAYVEALRAVVLEDGRFEERIKWGHLVYFCNGPALLIRAEDHRVLFGFWRGKRMLDIEPRMTGSGKYEMRTLELRENTPFERAVATALTATAHDLNLSLGNPAISAG